jgi:hypothetical protein
MVTDTWVRYRLNVSWRRNWFLRQLPHFLTSQLSVNPDLFTLGQVVSHPNPPPSPIILLPAQFRPRWKPSAHLGLPFKHSPWPRRRPADGGRRRGGRRRRPRWAPPRGCSSTRRCCTTWCGARPRPSSGGGTRSIR